MMRDDFCVFILSHGRPDHVYTYKTLMRVGYTGKVFIVIDDEDDTADEYRKQYGDKVLQFCKSDYAAKLDEGDNSGKRISTIYARAAMFDLAPQVGCRYFIQFDDDYHFFQYCVNGAMQGCYIQIRKTFNEMLEVLLEFFKSTNAVTVCMSQGGDWIGGANGKMAVAARRKAMNSFICSVDRPWVCLGRMNEDVNAYVVGGRAGQLFFTIMQVMLGQTKTQQTSGGMADMYLETGTYIKTFYSVMYAPSCVRVGTFGDHRTGNYRIHHSINWHNVTPKILRENHRKGQDVTNG